MGVSVKKNSISSATSMAPPPMHDYHMPMEGYSMSTALDKSKKRKR
jgi:hypothetical protein